jgi:hypothetical protein
VPPVLPRDEEPTSVQPVAAGTATTLAEEPPRRGRRAALVLVAGLVLLALALAGLTYALLNREDGGGTAGGGGTPSRTASQASPTPTETREPTPTEEEPSPTPTRSSPSPSPTLPPQSVHVTVVGTRTDYTGSCPPPQAEAPSFTATFTVGRLPARVEYRWVTVDGQVMDGGWKTLSLPEGGPRSGQDTVIVTTHAQEGTYRDELGVEVRGPVETRSGTVAFSVTCVRETPTGGASPSPTPSE